MEAGDVICGWRIVEDAGAGRSEHVFIVCREDDQQAESATAAFQMMCC